MFQTINQFLAMKKINWKIKEFLISEIKPTPNNFKIRIEDGAARFEASVKNYGLAGSVIINRDKTLIDGNSRLEKAKKMGMKKIWASFPDRQLTAREFTEFAAMIDHARAGEVDLVRIKEELGTTESFFKKWGMPIPKAALKQLAQLEKNESVINPTAKRKIADEIKDIPLRKIELLFTNEQAEEYLRLGESMYSKLKVDNITDFSLASAKKLAKLLR